jgi:hypothetical protein
MVQGLGSQVRAAEIWNSTFATPYHINVGNAVYAAVLVVYVSLLAAGAMHCWWSMFFSVIQAVAVELSLAGILYKQWTYKQWTFTVIK